MPSKLAILAGAGASHDLIGTRSATVEPDWQPPLTAGVFGPSRTFQAILDTYPGALTLASSIGIKVAQGQTLEGVLKILSQSSDEHLLRQFRQIPLYLQQLFWDISRLYCSEPVNYSYLLNEVFKSTRERVVLLTTNYDLFLERALHNVLNVDFTTWEDYLLDSRFLLAKLHGSVNWAYRIEGVVKAGGGDDKGMALNIINQRAIEQLLTPPFEILHNLRRIDWDAKALLYPVLTVPVEGKYEFAGPPFQIEQARKALESCTHLLVLGMSGLDQDVMDMLGECLTQCQSLLVVGGHDHLTVCSRFSAALRSSPAAQSVEGFTQFLSLGGLDSYLADLV